MEKEEFISVYTDLKQFWDSAFNSYEPSVINETWIEDEKFISAVNKYVDNESNVLDYACGSGWGISEIYIRKSFKFGLGIDTSKNAIECSKKCAELSNFDRILFKNGDQNVLVNYKEKFDFVLCINLFDVIPDELIDDILIKIKSSMKIDAHFFLGLNPDFTVDELINMIKMEQKGHYFYKEGHLRANKKNIEEWCAIFSKYFKVIESFKFALVEKEKKYPRVGFILEK